MSIYDNNKELLSTLGVEGNYSTDFEVRKAILNALGGDASACNSIYEVDLQILKIYQEGGGSTGGGKFVLGDDIKLGYSNFREVPEYFDFSQTTDFSYMFNSCENLTEIPYLDTSKSTSFLSMFEGCRKLTEIPYLDTSSSTFFDNMFSGCVKLTEIPYLDTSKGTSFNYMFMNCQNLTMIPYLDTSNGIAFNFMFYSCKNLEEIEGELDFSKVKDNYGLNSVFSASYHPNTKLVKVLFKGFINYNIGFDGCTSLSYESVKSILTACSNTINTNSKTVTFSRTLTDQNGELTNLIATCNTKGWTVSGLTLE